MTRSSTSGFSTVEFGATISKHRGGQFRATKATASLPPFQSHPSRPPQPRRAPRASSLLPRAPPRPCPRRCSWVPAGDEGVTVVTVATVVTAGLNPMRACTGREVDTAPPAAPRTRKVSFDQSMGEFSSLLSPW